MVEMVADPRQSDNLLYGPLSNTGAHVLPFVGQSASIADAYLTIAGDDHSSPIYASDPSLLQHQYNRIHELSSSILRQPCGTLFYSIPSNSSLPFVSSSSPREGDYYPSVFVNSSERPSPTAEPNITPPAPSVVRSSPSDPGLLLVQCRLRLHDGRTCNASFDVEPDFKTHSQYGQHVLIDHAIPPDVTPGDLRLPWTCTWDGCKCKSAKAGRCCGYPPGHAAHTCYPLAHIRTHLGYRFRCDKCGHVFPRPWLLRRHRIKNCKMHDGSLGDGFIHERDDRRCKAGGATTIAPAPCPPSTHGAFWCASCGRCFDTADDLANHRDAKGCISGSSSSV
jgi:hypothetical protein